SLDVLFDADTLLCDHFPYTTLFRSFIGSAFVHHVIAHTDDTVTVLDRLTYAGHRSSLEDLLSRRVRLIVGDVADAATVEPLVAEIGRAHRLTPVTFRSRMPSTA